MMNWEGISRGFYRTYKELKQATVLEMLRQSKRFYRTYKELKPIVDPATTGAELVFIVPIRN